MVAGREVSASQATGIDYMVIFKYVWFSKGVMEDASHTSQVPWWSVANMYSVTVCIVLVIIHVSQMVSERACSLVVSAYCPVWALNKGCIVYSSLSRNPKFNFFNDKSVIKGYRREKWLWKENLEEGGIKKALATEHKPDPDLNTDCCKTEHGR